MSRLADLWDRMQDTAVISEAFKHEIYRMAEMAVQDAFQRGKERGLEEAQSIGHERLRALTMEIGRLEGSVDELLEHKASLIEHNHELKDKVLDLERQNEELRDALEDVRDVAIDRAPNHDDPLLVVADPSCAVGEAPGKEAFYAKAIPSYPSREWVQQEDGSWARAVEIENEVGDGRIDPDATREEGHPIEPGHIPSFSHFIEKEDIDDILRGSYTEEGVKQWWTRRRNQLRTHTPGGGYLSPEQAWSLGRKRDVYNLAVSALSQQGS